MLLPVLSFTILAWVPAAQAWWRGRSAGWLTTAVGLLLASVGVLYGMGSDRDGAGWGLLLIGNGIGGVAAAVMARPVVFNKRDDTDPAIRGVLRDRERRTRAREIAESDPSMALELNIGRPDVPGAYADGGLIDLNNASAAGIVRVLGWTTTTAERFVTERDTRRGYASLTEIVALSGFDPRTFDGHADRIVVLPYRPR
ncbi:ComEA family DNA-binding protein [Haloactinopolyspora alba]|nr:helix-hairpin-helix domain-containing protein [Haloactinopolyspora alba]